MRDVFPGLLVAIVVAVLAQFIHQEMPTRWGLSVLVVAILLGAFVGHFISVKQRVKLESGLSVSRGKILRLAIILYGFNITFQQFSEVGLVGFGLAISMIIIILSVGIYVGTRLFKLDIELAVLIAIGSAICGAAAIAAAEPIIRSSPYKVAVAVATVVIFGTFSMFLYPLIAQYIVMSDLHYGLWVGASIHEVAQVVVAGSAISDAAGHIAVVEKMIRVTMLVPVLIILSCWQAFRIKKDEGGQITKSGFICIPWFALFFLVMVGVNSMAILPAWVVSLIVLIDGYLLTIAMAALGVMTHVSVMKKAGGSALSLAGVLFVILSVGGFLLASFWLKIG